MLSCQFPAEDGRSVGRGEQRIRIQGTQPVAPLTGHQMGTFLPEIPMIDAPTPLSPTTLTTCRECIYKSRADACMIHLYLRVTCTGIVATKECIVQKASLAASLPHGVRRMFYW